MLPPDTTLYDLTVEGDESFVIESIFAHNCGQGCKCAWEIRPLDAAKGDFDCYWRLRPAEHCQTCRVRARDWYPLRVRGWQLVVPEERTFREAQTSLKQAFAALGLPAERLKGGPGSGHFGHAGRPGKHGGSLPGNVALGIHASPEARLQRIAAAYARTLATLRRGGADAGQIAALARRALAKIDAFSTDENAAAAHALDDLHTWGDRKLFTQEDYLREGSRRLAQVTELHKLREGALRTVLMEGLALPEGAAYAPQIRTYFIGQLTTTPHYAAYLEGVGQLLRLVPAARVDARIPNPFIGGARSAGDALAINIGLVGSGSGEYIPSSDTISINPAAEYAGGLDFTRSAVVHEVAHWLTARMPGVYAASRAEFARRTANEPAVVDPRTRTFTKKDQFLDPYMGRLYSQYSAADGTGRIFREPSRESLDGCELISTAAEHFYRTPAQLLQRDPQTFHFLLTTLFGVPPGGAE